VGFSCFGKGALPVLVSAMLGWTINPIYRESVLAKVAVFGHTSCSVSLVVEMQLSPQSLVTE
jgi:hypothetical protein